MEVKKSNDLISKLDVLDIYVDLYEVFDDNKAIQKELHKVFDKINALPSAQPEPLTDKEQRIFLAAMGREEKVCEKVDRNYVGKPYEDSLMRVCKEIRRKVKGALWT